MFFHREKKTKWWEVVEPNTGYKHYLNNKEAAKKYISKKKSDNPGLKIYLKRWRGN